MMDVLIHGGCLCGAVTYTATSPSKEAFANAYPSSLSPHGKIVANHCHCDTCRQSSGALFQTLAEIPFQWLDIVDSKNSLTTFRVYPNAEREHCKICGTSLWIKDTRWDDPNVLGLINVSVGSMKKEDAKKWVYIRHHIFMGDTVNGGTWEFKDDLPKYMLR